MRFGPLGHPGPFGRARRARRLRLTFVVDVEVPDGISPMQMQYAMLDALDLALYIIGTRGERIGSTIENMA